MQPQFFITATPIGNRDDITTRAIQTLSEVDFIVAEDTRHTGQLLTLYGIKKPYISFRDAPQPIMDKAINEVLERLEQGQSGALVTDAGTPGVSDPGWRMVAALVSAGIQVTALPGPSAVTMLVSLCDIPLEEYRFVGFLPKKKGFQTKIIDLVTYLSTKEVRGVIFYESPNRIRNTLSVIANEMKQSYRVSRQIYCIVGRELTKKFETVYRGVLAPDLIATLPEKGEYVVLLTQTQSDG